MQLKDTAHRTLAAIPGNFNIIVEAGAGTGKTTLLINRLCYLTIGRDIPIQKIIALTFTDKAAAEIKLRLQAKMQTILTQLDTQIIKDETTLTLLNTFAKTKTQIRQNIQNYFDFAERAQICTIHSFCLNILHKYPLEAALAPQCAVDEGSYREKLFNNQWSTFLELELSFNSPNQTAWQAVLDVVNLDDVKNFAWAIIKAAAADYHPLRNSAAVAELCQKYIFKAQELLGIYRDNTKCGNMIAKLDCALNALKETMLFLDSGHADRSTNEIGTMPSCPKYWAGQDYEEALAILGFAAELNVNNQLALLKAYGIVAPFIQNFNAQFIKENSLSFHDIIIKTKQLLRGNSVVRGELKREYESILIDEFQDTDPAQGEILLFLAEAQAANPAANWQDIVLEQGKLFVVGDPKQTIYNFRGADINAYEKFTDLMLRQGAKRCFLQTNFRSAPQIIAFANAAGAALIQVQKGVQPSYIPIEAGRIFVAPPVMLAAVDAGLDAKHSTEAYRHNQAQFIAAWIVQNAGTTITADGSPLALKDIAILLRTTTALSVYTAALQRFNIKYTVEADNNFYNSQEVLDMLNILKVIYDPQDTAALVGVLRSPLGLLTDGQIIVLKQQNCLSIFASVPDTLPNAQKVFDMLKNLYNMAGKMPLRQLVSKIIFDTPFLEMQTISTAKEQAVANIFKLFDIITQMRALGVLSLGQFLFTVKEFIDKQKKEGASPLTEETLDTVNIMTIHKAKGLEFKAVILADISKEERQTRHRPDYLFDWDRDIYGFRLGTLADCNFALLEPARIIHGKAEELRVLYVALTRAKERLVLVGDLTEDKNSIAGALQKAALYPICQNSTVQAGGYNADIICTPYRAPEAFVNTSAPNSLTQTLKLDIAAWQTSWAKRLTAFESINSKQTYITPSVQETAVQGAVLTGLISHKMMETIFDASPKTAPQCAAMLGVEGNTDDIKAAQAIIIQFENSPVFALLKTYKLLASEMPFTAQADGLIINGVIDAIFETPTGLLIVDYKTDNILPMQAAGHSLQYTRQIKYYKDAVSKLMPTKTLQAAIIYLRTQQIINI